MMLQPNILNLRLFKSVIQNVVKNLLKIKHLLKQDVGIFRLPSK